MDRACRDFLDCLMQVLNLSNHLFDCRVTKMSVCTSQGRPFLCVAMLGFGATAVFPYKIADFSASGRR
jgi:hypothetical protein